MKYLVENVNTTEYPILVGVWERAVRATHHFLNEEDIAFYRERILNEYLDAVTLRCIRKKDEIIGFYGISEQTLEMLFVIPELHGKSVGKTLLQDAIQQFQITKVDVNADNPDALLFYEKNGFHAFERSETDGCGKPYPILHLQLIPQTINMINLNNKLFVAVENSTDGEVSESTRFEYHQEGSLVWADYSGGEILKGHLIAQMDSNGNLDMKYHHLNVKNELMTGVCSSKPELLPDGRVRLYESWKWTSGNGSSGTSILEEIKR